MIEKRVTPIPEQGQLVDVRGRAYVVADVAKGELPVSLITQPPPTPFHLITLNAVEEDALGEELQVFWELEVNRAVRQQSTLPSPTGFDTPHRLQAFLNAVRWGATVTADGRSLQSPFRSGIEIEDYQLDPVVRAVQMPRVNLLIADDVGLGKTIEAGLVIQELIVRQRARRVLIVCPASLQIQWREQMRDKFGLEFRIVDSELMADLRRKRGIHVNPWNHFPRLITSVDYLKRDRPLRLFRETLPAPGESIYPRRYDLLLVDEAHNVAPSGRGKYAIDSQRTQTIRMIAPHFEHRLFLTATPHNGYSESFSALLELVDNQRFARGVPPDPLQLRQVMVRRLKSELPPDDFGQPRFLPRQIQALEVAYSEEERTLHQLLQQYARMRQQNSHDQAERTATDFVLKLLKKRLFSSPAAFAKTLAQHQQTMLGKVKDEDAASSRSRLSRANVGILRARLESMEEEYADTGEAMEATDDALDSAGSLFRPLTASEDGLLRQMVQRAELQAQRADNKALRLLHWLEVTLRPNGEWNDERIILFTEYRDTQKWLHELLAAQGLASQDRLMVLHGGLNSDERERIKAAFQTSPAVSPVRILLATDAASEGIDLQLHCHRLLHYEIPWNPNRMEQRNGRIDRHGQRQAPQIFHFAPPGYAERSESSKAGNASLPLFGNNTPQQGSGALEWDLEFLLLAVHKVEQIRSDLGKVGPVIADQVTEAMLGRRHSLQTDDAERTSEPVRRMLRFEQNLNQRIQELHLQLQETRRDLQLQPENVQAVVEIALQLAQQPSLQATEAPDTPGTLPLNASHPKQTNHFLLPALRNSWARCSEGLAHPHTGEPRPLVFDHNLARGRDDVVLAHLNHRLVQMSLRLLRAQVWSNSGHSDLPLHRVTARLVPDHLLGELCVIAHARLLIIGGDSQRLHEELIQAGGEIRQGSFRRFESLRRQDELLQAATEQMPLPHVLEKLKALWSNLETPLQRALESRMNERSQSLQRKLEERCDKERNDIRLVLEELARSIRNEIADEASEGALQLPLFNEEEQQQYRRNLDALNARLEAIPAEILAEQETIQRRYHNPQARLFPVAVTFLVPARLNR